MTARYLVADVFDGLKTLEDGTVDLVVTSPPFLALRSYLPADHPDKHREIGSEATPAAFIDVMLAVTAELRRVLAPHGSIAVEFGDTYAGSGGAGGDYNEHGIRAGQPRWDGSVRLGHGVFIEGKGRLQAGEGWPLAKSRALIPELYRIALAYGINPLTGKESPAGKWRIRNVVTWCRPNPPVGALGDKWRPATSDVVIACVSEKRYWDDIATRGPISPNTHARSSTPRYDLPSQERDGNWSTLAQVDTDPTAGAPLLDWWSITAGGYPGSHYAVFSPKLVEPLVKAMAPPKVCRTCGEPSRRIVDRLTPIGRDSHVVGDGRNENSYNNRAPSAPHHDPGLTTLGWSDCGHDDFRPALVLDCFGGSGTTGAVATGHGHEAVLIDLDERNVELARERIGPMLFDGPHYVTSPVDVRSDAPLDSELLGSLAGHREGRG